LSWALAASATSTTPRGWYLAGTKPAEYESGVDANAGGRSHHRAYLKAKASAVEGFGTLMQNVRADQYAGKRIRFSALVKTQDVERWAGLWMRVDLTSTCQSHPFDNMHDRPIKGTAEWQSYSVVLDVPIGATDISFGVLLNGTGSVWFDGVKLEDVGPEVETTGKLTRLHGPCVSPPLRPEWPVNLDFQQ
jgi:hypothetical protein